MSRLLMTIVAVSSLMTACSSDTAERNASPAPSPAASSAAAPAAPAPPPQPQKSPVQVAFETARSKTREQNRNLIAELIGNGVFSQVELQEGVPRVYVRPAYRLLTDRDKHLYFATIFTFAFPEGTGPGTADRVVLVDDVSGQEIGSFTEAGFQR